MIACLGSPRARIRGYGDERALGGGVVRVSGRRLLVAAPHWAALVLVQVEPALARRGAVIGDGGDWEGPMSS